MRPCWRAGAGVLLGGLCAPTALPSPTYENPGKAGNWMEGSQLHQQWLAARGYDFLRCFPTPWVSFILYLGCIFYAVKVENWEINVILHCAKLDVFVYDGLFTREPIQKEL